ncbi:hypothetical protein IHQ71_28420 [Rhizobium sp. TH2]|uniref:DNA polymerase n=1 Tax=Rhizobium sp. TH2 TaxID=2775403 RepID=UPI002157400E|nr:DNA polymerase [Rhizobium sp. TH2]UVC08990.1 hypothetical protein IHQ71_28420 [Rhizobium sp. TH2]
MDYTFKIEPDEHGGRQETVTLAKQPIYQKPLRGRKKPPDVDAYLLIGFDTEYQSIDSTTGKIAEGAKNELLSYQFYVRLIHRSEEHGHLDAAGIIVPSSGDRYPQDKFLGIAIASFLQRYPDVVLPRKVYLVGHFTRADLPAFEDFLSLRTVMSNIRNTFISIDRFKELTLSDGDDVHAELEVMIRDTMLLAPGSARSLAGLGEIVGLPKIVLDADPAKELDIKENMARFRSENWLRFREYAIRDAHVCVEYATKVMRQYQVLFNVFKLPATLTSFGTKLVTEGWEKKRGWSKNSVLGRETVEVRQYKPKLGYFLNTQKNPFIEDVDDEMDFVCSTYHGGRNEQFLFGVADEGVWRDHDLSSAYTTAMSIIGMPKWNEVTRLQDFGDVEPWHLSYFSMDFEFDPSTRFPTLPVRTANGIIFPLRGHTKCGAPELFLAQKLGAKLRFRKGLHVPTDPEMPIFRDFISMSINERSKHQKGTFGNLFWKEVGNSTYGKTAQGLREKRVYDLRSDELKAIPESEITQPFFASFITSYTRAVLGEILNRFSANTTVFSVTTDGFLSNATDAEITNATSGALFRSFSGALAQLDTDRPPLDVKHTIAQPVGWRTRGSATIKRSNPSEVVLQKGGIKVNALFDDLQENDFTVRQFLNRTPDSVVTYKSSVGVKDMIRNDTDFVFKTVEKRLSMEFDWKRKPVSPQDVEFEYEGDIFSHLMYKTVPLEDEVEFRAYRESWEKYTKKTKHNLKTLEDFDKFQRAMESRRYSNEEVSRYARGPLPRLRQQLTIAFKHERAGFDAIRAKRKISHGDFRQALESSGIPCSISDIDNAKRAKEFKPRNAIRNPEVIAALEMLKQNHYPELETDEI